MKSSLFKQSVSRVLLLCMVAAHVLAVIQPRPGSSGSSSSSSGGSRRGRGKHNSYAGPSPGFSGGQTLDNNDIRWCNSPALPGCQACNDGSRCTACWTQYPNATGSRFVLNQFTGQCDCPPGYGLWPNLPPPTWPAPHRHLLAQLPAVPDLDQALGQDLTAVSESKHSLDQAADKGWPVSALGQVPEASASAKATQPTDALDSAQTLAIALAAAGPMQSEPVQATKQSEAAMQLAPLAHLQVLQQGLWLPDPLPAWSTHCMPCPVNYYSPGGQQGFAQCRPCPGGFTTAGATAAANCLFPYCGPGQEPTRRLGRCRACPLGTYSSAIANNQPCYPCPSGFTTATTGSRTFGDCRVPICAPGQELDLDLFVCTPCQGNTISPGGKVSQGTLQPRCEECPWGTAANETNRVCYTGTCPYPDVFRIDCKKDKLAPCGPNGKPANINQYCTAYPPGSVLAWYEPRTFTANARLTQETSCPAGANSSSTKFPVIVSFNGRKDCLCAPDASCWFETAGAARGDFVGGTASARLVNENINVTIPDPQDRSLRILVQAMAGSNQTAAYTALYRGYCGLQQPVITEGDILDLGQIIIYPPGVVTAPLRNWTNPLQVNCTGQYITRIALQPTLNNTLQFGPWTADGTLPRAALLKGLSQLQMLSCPWCGMDGTLPKDWGTQDSLMELRDLDLSGNNFTGPLPETWGYMVNLQRLTLSSSSVSMGTIPSAWGYMRSLVFVNLTGVTLDVSAESCAPWQWKEVNGLVLGDTLIPPFTFPTMDFCDRP